MILDERFEQRYGGIPGWIFRNLNERFGYGEISGWMFG